MGGAPRKKNFRKGQGTSHSGGNVFWRPKHSGACKLRNTELRYLQNGGALALLEEGRDLPITCMFWCFPPFNERVLEQTWASLESVTPLRRAPQSLRLLLVAGFPTGPW